VLLVDSPDLSSTFASGDTFTGTFVVDDASISTSPTANGSISSYAISSFAVSFPSYTAVANGGSISVTDDGDFGNPSIEQLDNYTLIVGAANYTSAPAVNGFNPANFVIVFEQRHAPPITALADSSLPLDPDGTIGGGYQNLQFDGYRNVMLRRTDVMYRGVAVPEPSVLWLIGSGLSGLAFIRCRFGRTRFNS
jgi:hypothetical protein